MYTRWLSLIPLNTSVWAPTVAPTRTGWKRGLPPAWCSSTPVPPSWLTIAEVGTSRALSRRPTKKLAVKFMPDISFGPPSLGRLNRTWKLVTFCTTTDSGAISRTRAGTGRRG